MTDEQKKIAELQWMVARLVGALLVSGTITSDAKKEYLEWLERNVKEEE